MILVTGATGNVGQEVVRQLAAAGQKVRALVHDRRIPEMRRRYVSLYEGNLDDRDSVRAALYRCDRVYLLSPATPELQHREANVIDAAIRAGIDHIVLHSVIGAGELDGRFFRVHAEAEHKLRGSSIAWTIVRPSLFMTNLLRTATMIRRDGRLPAPAGKGRVAFIDPADIAQAAVALMTTSGHAGETYELTGPEAPSYDEIAARIGAATGRHIAYEDVSPEAARKGMLELGFPTWSTDGILEVFAAVKAGKLAEVTGDFAKLVGRPSRSLDEFLHEHGDAFRGVEAERPRPQPQL